MPVSIQFFGAAAYKIITEGGRHVLIDPFLDKNPYSPVKTKDLDQVDLLLLTHNAFDHSKELTVKGSEPSPASTGLWWI
jgi:L-ascorbate metabolism protein UlaG (beta-lactamase superfamily)